MNVFEFMSQHPFLTFFIALMFFDSIDYAVKCFTGAKISSKK
ncbi:hypothetical protein [Carnobacterium maltaromaticum]|nr:hypothetical protein [Carnobacterium maltaromaticum]